MPQMMFESIEDLIACHQQALLGFIRVRAKNDDDADDIFQETIQKVIKVYDPHRADTFLALAKRWAGFMLVRYYSPRSNPWQLRLLVSELCSRFPELSQEEEMGSVLDRLALTSPERTVERESIDQPIVDAEWEKEVYEALLRATFVESHPPYQVIIVGYRFLLEYKIEKIVDERFSSQSLQELAYELEEGYCFRSQLPRAYIHPFFGQFSETLERKFEDVVKDSKIRALYPHLFGCVIGEIALKDFYTGSKEEWPQKVSLWCDSVKRRIREVFRKSEQESQVALFNTWKWRKSAK